MASIGLVACGNSTTGGTGNGLAADQTLRFPIFGDFGTLDPGLDQSETDSEIAQNLFNGLVRFDNSLTVVPDIASAMPDISADGLTYTFKLRHDVTFSNGDKVTAADFIYSWNRAAALQGGYAGNLAPVVGYDKVAKNTVTGAALEALLDKNDPSVSLSGLNAPDPYTLVVKLSAPAGYFLQAIGLQSTTGMVVDQKVVKTDPDNWWTKPETLVGTGAFKMTARTPKQSVEFQAVSNWWGSPKPTLKKVAIDILSDSSTGVKKYEQKGYDAVGMGGYSNLNVADVLRIKADPVEGKELTLQPKVRSYWVSFNEICDAKRAAKGPFCGTSKTAHDLRLAFALAVDKTALVHTVCQDIVCTPATGGLINKGLAGYLGDGADPLSKFDVTQAKALLKSADPTGSLTKSLEYAYDPNNPLNGPTATNLQDQWKTNLGVNVSLKSVDHSTFIKTRLKGGYVMARDGWQADYNHPQDWFDNLWGTIAGSPDGTTSGYGPKAYDDLLKKADAEPLSQALTDYKTLSQMLIDDANYIPLYYSVGAFLYKPYVKNAGTNNFFDFYWDQIQIGTH